MSNEKILRELLQRIIRQADTFLTPPPPPPPAVGEGEGEAAAVTEKEEETPPPLTTAAPPPLTVLEPPTNNLTSTEAAVVEGEAKKEAKTPPLIPAVAPTTTTRTGPFGLKVKKINDDPPPPTNDFKPLSISQFINNANNILATLGKLSNVTIPPPPPIVYKPISVANYLQQSLKILTDILKNNTLPPTPFIKTEAYRNFITKLIADTSFSFNQYYPDTITISEPQEQIEDEKRLLFKDDSTYSQGAQPKEMKDVSDPSPVDNTLNIREELPQKTYSASIQTLGDDVYVPSIVLDKSPQQLTPKVAEGTKPPEKFVGGKTFDTNSLNIMVCQADKLLKQIIKENHFPMKTGGSVKALYDAPVLKKRAYNASNDINQLFKDSNTKLIFKKESPVKYDDDIVDEKVTPENHRKIELSELKINITEDTENKEDYEKEYDLSLENTSPEKLQEMLVNSSVTDESKKALEKILGLAKPQIMCTDPMSCMSYMSDSFAREIYRPTIIIQ